MDLTKWQRPAPVDLWDAFEGLRGDMDRALDLFRTPDVAGLRLHVKEAAAQDRNRLGRRRGGGTQGPAFFEPSYLM